MIVFGPTNCVRQLPNPSNWVIFNLNSPINMGANLFNLPPVWDQDMLDAIAHGDEPLFDSLYFEYIVNKGGFCDYMRLLLHDYYGSNVYVCIDTESVNQYREIYTESIIKLTQVRYGVLINKISDIEDLNYCIETDYSAIGIQTFEADKERFVMLTSGGGEEFGRYICE